MSKMYILNTSVTNYKSFWHLTIKRKNEDNNLQEFLTFNNKKKEWRQQSFHCILVTTVDWSISVRIVLNNLKGTDLFI